MSANIGKEWELEDRRPKTEDGRGKKIGVRRLKTEDGRGKKRVFYSVLIDFISECNHHIH